MRDWKNKVNGNVVLNKEKISNHLECFIPSIYFCLNFSDSIEDSGKKTIFLQSILLKLIIRLVAMEKVLILIVAQSLLWMAMLFNYKMDADIHLMPIIWKNM